MRPLHFVENKFPAGPADRGAAGGGAGDDDDDDDKSEGEVGGSCGGVHNLVVCTLCSCYPRSILGGGRCKLNPNLKAPGFKGST